MSSASVDDRSDRELLAAARAGDQAAFGSLVDPHRRALHALCYQLLGSLHDAEDALQDALLRAWRGLEGFNERSSILTWLYRIATNVCLDALNKRQRRFLPVDYGPAVTGGESDAETRLADELWIEPYPGSADDDRALAAAPHARIEHREALELAVVAALQLLPPRQRAVLVLRDVLGFSAAETAEAIESTVPAVNSALQRARRAIDEQLPDRSQQETLRALGDARVRDVVERFVDAFERAAIDEILALLSEDAVFAMPPYREWSRGREAVERSWLMPVGAAGELRYAATRANGQLALGVYRLKPTTGEFLAHALDVLTLGDDGLITEVVAFRRPELLAAFGLPAILER